MLGDSNTICDRKLLPLLGRQSPMSGVAESKGKTGFGYNAFLIAFPREKQSAVYGRSVHQKPCLRIRPLAE